MRDFVGSRVLGSASGSTEPLDRTGRLVVYTYTHAVDDGGIFYYPHRPYELLDRRGNLVRRVVNHRGENDETPMRIDLAPGTYLVRTESDRSETLEFLVNIETGKLTELDVPAEVQRRR